MNYTGLNDYAHNIVEWLIIRKRLESSTFHLYQKELNEWQDALPNWEGHKDEQHVIDTITGYDYYLNIHTGNIK